MSARSARHHHNLRAFVYQRDGGRCWLCHRLVAPPEVSLDHILPRALGGPKTRENLRLAHKHCNHKRGCPEVKIDPAEIVKIEQGRRHGHHLYFHPFAELLASGNLLPPPREMPGFSR